MRGVRMLREKFLEFFNEVTSATLGALSLFLAYKIRRIFYKSMEDKMEKDIELSKEAGLKIEVVGGKVKVAVKLDTKGVDAEVAVLLEPDYFADKLKEAIPGKIDDAVIDVLKAALKLA